MAQSRGCFFHRPLLVVLLQRPEHCLRLHWQPTDARARRVADGVGDGCNRRHDGHLSPRLECPAGAQGPPPPGPPSRWAVRRATSAGGSRAASRCATPRSRRSRIPRAAPTRCPARRRPGPAPSTWSGFDAEAHVLKRGVPQQLNLARVRVNLNVHDVRGGVRRQHAKVHRRRVHAAVPHQCPAAAGCLLCHVRPADGHLGRAPHVESLVGVVNVPPRRR